MQSFSVSQCSYRRVTDIRRLYFRKAAHDATFLLLYFPSNVLLAGVHIKPRIRFQACSHQGYLLTLHSRFLLTEHAIPAYPHHTFEDSRHWPCHPSHGRSSKSPIFESPSVMSCHVIIYPTTRYSDDRPRDPTVRLRKQRLWHMPLAAPLLVKPEPHIFLKYAMLCYRKKRDGVQTY